MGDFQPTNSHPLDDRECFVCFPCPCPRKDRNFHCVCNCEPLHCICNCVCHCKLPRKDVDCHCVFSPQANTTIISRVTPAPDFTTDYADVYVSGVTKSDVKDKARLIKNFDEFDFPNNFNLERYKKPTPIQKAAIPIMMEGKDLVAVSQTGSGKTIAYLIPMLTEIIDIRNHEKRIQNSPLAVILVPKRELTNQVKREIDLLLSARQSNVNCAAVYSGKESPQNADVLIATPGKLLNLHKSGKISLDELRYLIIDEADTILEQFERDHEMGVLKRIIKENEVQTALFCAVMPDYVFRRRRRPQRDKKILYHERIKEYLKEDYIHVSVKKSDSIVKEISQEFYKTEEEEKFRLLKRVLDQCLKEKKRVIVFVETKKDTAHLAVCLCKSGYPVTVMHSNRSQKDRELSLYLFNEDHTPIMICTSVTAHGFDIPEIDTVVNFHLPDIKWDNFSTYLYRVGRAGRAGNRGEAVSFFVPNKDEWLAPAVVTELVKKQLSFPDWLDEMCKPENIDPSLKEKAILAMRDSASLVVRGRGAEDSRISGFEMITQVEGDKHTELNVERVHRGK